MCAVYAFARETDDIGDGAMPNAEKRAGLDAMRARLGQIGSANGDLVIRALSDAHERFALPLDALDDLIEGVWMDVEGARFESFDELVLYCRRVAGSIGRLCVAIFGTNGDGRAIELADDLGIAMQLTNILRDVREDWEHGRMYLPAEDLGRFGCESFPDTPPERFAALIAFEAARGREWFDRGLELVPLLDTRSASCVLAMSGIYRRLLERIDESPAMVMNTRLSVPTWEKAWVVARSVVEAAA
jgi:phytoene synthase